MSAVFRVVGNGTEEYFRTEQGLELLDAAHLLWDNLQRLGFLNTRMYAEMFPAWEQISLEEFHRLAALRMENTGEVAGAFDLDFDRKEFSAVHIMDGWKTFSMIDVYAAANDAFCAERLDREEQWDRLLNGLHGKELTWEDRLPEQDIDPFSGPTM